MGTHMHALSQPQARGRTGKSGGASESNISVLDPMARQARECFEHQAAAIASLGARLEDGAFGRAIKLLEATEGHVIVSGIGKSGLVGQKISATLASTGSPSFFLHAAEAFHGDLGAVTSRDAVLLISYSGETEEVTRLLPHLRTRRVPTVALTGKVESTLGQNVDVCLDVSVDRELCPHNLAPTNSSLATLAMGDALSVALMNIRGFHAEDFAKLHPGGSLGRRVLGRVRDAMVRGPLPVVSPTGTASDCVFALARGRLPIALVMDGERLRGTVSEVELRRALSGSAGLDMPVTMLMNPHPATISDGEPLREAEYHLRHEGVEALVALDTEGRVTGVLPSMAEG